MFNSELNVAFNTGLGGNGELYEVIVRYNGSLAEVAADLDVIVEILNSNFAIITLTPDKVNQLYSYPQIVYIELPRILTSDLHFLESACINSVRDPNNYGLTGQGVLIAIIDSGIDYTHPDFRNDDGSTRILSIWDQQGFGSPPTGFPFGAEYTSAQINEALNSSDPFSVVPVMDIQSHGTAVAGVAAGNGRVNSNVLGAAPQASLLVVRLGNRGRASFARTTEIMRAIRYSYDKAIEFNMPLAVNISLGTNNGSHDGNSLFEGFINDMCNTWKSVVVVATGNEGTAGHHYSSVLTNGETLEIAYSTGPQLTEFFVTMWKNFVDRISVELIVPSGDSTGIVNVGDPVGEVRGRSGTVRVYFGQPTTYNTDQEIFLSIQANEMLLIEGISRLIVRAINIVDGRIDLWLPTTEEVGTDTAFFLPSSNLTLTIPSTAFNVISVGAYDSNRGSAADFSGRGFTRTDVYVKPDIVAPGVEVRAPAFGGSYDTFTGTSIAAPFVTGSAALMMEWGIIQGNDPFLYGQRVKAFLRRGASRSPDIQYPNTIWGFGRLCLESTMDELFSYGNPARNIGALQ